MINMAFMPLYMWEMWDVTPVTDTRTDNGKVGQYSVWAESAICFLDAPVYWGRWNEMSKDFPLFLLQNLLRCSQSFQLVVSNLGNTTATSFHFDWSKHFQQINPFKQMQLLRALFQNNLPQHLVLKRSFLQIDSFSSQARGCLQSLSGCWRGLKLQAPPFRGWMSYYFT